MVHFFADDDTTGVELFYGGYAPGTRQTYSQARVGAEFGVSPWSSFPYIPPATETHLVTFQNSVLVTYSGSVSGFRSSWTRHKILATSDGSSAGTVQVRPSNLANAGANFDVFLEPAS